MFEYLIEYAAIDGRHEEAVEGWDQEHAVQSWRAAHSGQRVHLLDVTMAGKADECYA